MISLHIVLVEPEIPQNTGNIARTCAATGAQLHLVGRLGFSVDESRVRRAGLDYWPMVKLSTHPSLDAFFGVYDINRAWFLTTKARTAYSGARFRMGDILVFGKETRGLPDDLLTANNEKLLRIPMLPGARSLNLANSVAVVLYEALRQTGFTGLTP